MTEATKVARSHSQLTLFAECGWKYKLRYFDRKVEDPAVWLAGGIAFHSATEAYDLYAWPDSPLETYRGDAQYRWDIDFEAQLGRLRDVEPDESKWRTAGRKSAALPHGQDVPWWRENGPIMVDTYVDWRIAHKDQYAIAMLPDGKPAIEFGGLNDTGDTPIKFFPDRVIVDRITGTLIVVDLKSGARMPPSTHQLGEYAVWIEQVYGMPVWYGSHYDARKGELEPPRLLTRWTDELVSEMYATLDRAIVADAFVPNIGRECAGCGYRRHCKYQPGYRKEVAE